MVPFLDKLIRVKSASDYMCYIDVIVLNPYPKAVVDCKVSQVQHVKVHRRRKHDFGDRRLVTQPR
mgnify:CR=1 FL=1